MITQSSFIINDHHLDVDVDQHEQNQGTHHKCILSCFLQGGCTHPCTGTAPLLHDLSATIQDDQVMDHGGYGGENDL